MENGCSRLPRGRKGHPGGDRPALASRRLCLEPWTLAYARPHAQHIAQASLEREGFEVFYPLRKVVTRRPARTLSSKTRHRRRLETIERVEAVFGCYLFVRRLVGDFAAAEFWKLPGVAGVCRIGQRIATIRDWEVELLRLAEAHGRFNICHASVPGAHRLAIEVDPRIGSDARHVGRHNGAAFYEEFGRVVRLIRDTSANKAHGHG